MKNVKPDKRDLIINKAIELFARNGFENVKVSDITESISIGKGTFYLYFQNKQELLFDCFNTFKNLPAPLENEMDSGKERGFLPRMGKRLENLLKHYDQYRGVLNLIRSSFNSDDVSTFEASLIAYGNIHLPVKEEIQKAIDTGILQETDAELASYFLVGGAESLASRLFMDDKYTPNQIVDFTVNFIAPLLGFAAEPAGKEFKAISAMVTDRVGIESLVEEIRFGGKLTLAGTLGEAVIQIDLRSVRFLTVNQCDSHWSIDFTLVNGKKGELSVDGELLVSGRIEFGDFEILLKKASKISFNV